jgi:hypothetical protein
MSETEKHATIWVKEADRAVFNELAAKSRMTVVEIQSQIAEGIKAILKDKEIASASKVLFMATLDQKNPHIIILRFNGLYCGTASQLPAVVQAQFETKPQKKVRKK